MEMNQYRQYYFYAKGWFKRTNIIDDLKKIQADYCGIEAKYISFENIINVLGKEVFKYIKDESDFTNFLDDVSPNNWKRSWGLNTSTYNYEISVLKKFMSVLAFQTIDNIDGELGDPDFKILPARERGQWKRFKKRNKGEVSSE